MLMGGGGNTFPGEERKGSEHQQVECVIQHVLPWGGCPVLYSSEAKNLCGPNTYMHCVRQLLVGGS